MSFSHVYGSCRTVWNGFAINLYRFLLNHRYPVHVWNMVASNVHISLSFVVCFIVFIHGWFPFLVPFNLLFIFIYFHLCSTIFIYFHLFLFIFISFHFFHVLLFFSLEKTITNLNHLHVDPRLSCADFGSDTKKFACTKMETNRIYIWTQVKINVSKCVCRHTHTYIYILKMCIYINRCN